MPAVAQAPLSLSLQEGLQSPAAAACRDNKVTPAWVEFRAQCAPRAPKGPVQPCRPQPEGVVGLALEAAEVFLQLVLVPAAAWQSAEEAQQPALAWQPRPPPQPVPGGAGRAPTPSGAGQPRGVSRPSTPSCPLAPSPCRAAAGGRPAVGRNGRTAGKPGTASRGRSWSNAAPPGPPGSSARASRGPELGGQARLCSLSEGDRPSVQLPAEAGKCCNASSQVARRPARSANWSAA